MATQMADPTTTARILKLAIERRLSAHEIARELDLQLPIVFDAFLTDEFRDGCTDTGILLLRIEQATAYKEMTGKLKRIGEMLEQPASFEERMRQTKVLHKLVNAVLRFSKDQTVPKLPDVEPKAPKPRKPRAPRKPKATSAEHTAEQPLQFPKLQLPQPPHETQATSKSPLQSADPAPSTPWDDRTVRDVRPRAAPKAPQNLTDSYNTQLFPQDTILLAK